MDQVLQQHLVLVHITEEEENGQIVHDIRWIIDPKRSLSRMFQRMQRMTYALILMYVILDDVTYAIIMLKLVLFL